MFTGTEERVFSVLALKYFKWAEKTIGDYRILTVFVDGVK